MSVRETNVEGQEYSEFDVQEEMVRQMDRYPHRRAVPGMPMIITPRDFYALPRGPRIALVGIIFVATISCLVQLFFRSHTANR